MLFTCPQKKTLIPHYPCIQSQEIKTNSSTNFLGVVSDHVSLAIKKIAPGLRALICARAFFDITTLVTLYYAFIQSY